MNYNPIRGKSTELYDKAELLKESNNERRVGSAWLLFSPTTNDTRVNDWSEFDNALFEGYGKIMPEFDSDDVWAKWKKERIIKSWHSAVLAGTRTLRGGWKYSPDYNKQTFANYLGGGGGLGEVVHFNQANNLISEIKEILVSKLLEKYAAKGIESLCPGLRFIPVKVSAIIAAMKREQESDELRPLGTVAYFLKFIGNILKGSTKIRIANPTTSAEVFFYIEDLHAKICKNQIREKAISAIFKCKDIARIYKRIRKKLHAIDKILGNKTSQNYKDPFFANHPKVDTTDIKSLKKCPNKKSFRNQYLKTRKKNSLTWIDGDKYTKAFYKSGMSGEWWLSDCEKYFCYAFGGWYDVAGKGKKAKEAREKLHSLYAEMCKKPDEKVKDENITDLFSSHVNAHIISACRFREAESRRESHRRHLVYEYMDYYKAKLDRRAQEEAERRRKKEEAEAAERERRLRVRRLAELSLKKEIRRTRSQIIKSYKKKRTRRRKISEFVDKLVTSAVRLIESGKARVAAYILHGKKKYRILMNNKPQEKEKCNEKIISLKKKEYTAKYKIPKKTKIEFRKLKSKIRKARIAIFRGCGDLVNKAIKDKRTLEAIREPGKVPISRIKETVVLRC